MSQPQEVDFAILKRAMFNVINEYVPSVEKFDSTSDNLKESNKELANFIISELTPKLQNALVEALDPDIDLDTFMRLNNIKVLSSKD